MQRTILALGTLALILSGCATVEEQPAKTALEPMADPGQYRVGATFKVIKNGEPQTWKVTAVDGKATLYEGSDGCKWSRVGIFSQSLSWENCNGGSGTQKVEAEGDLWPMEVGKTATYRFSGTNSKGNSWSGVQRCKVEGTVSVTTSTGDHDAYKVVCRDEWRTRTSYVSPAAGHRVLLTNRHNKRGTTDTYEILEINL